MFDVGKEAPDWLLMGKVKTHPRGASAAGSPQIASIGEKGKPQKANSSFVSLRGQSHIVWSPPQPTWPPPYA